MKKNVLVLVVILILTMTMFMACARQSRSDGPVTITVSTFAGDPYQISWRRMFDRFETETGVRVMHDVVPWTNLGERQAMEVASGSGSYDVLYVHPFWFENLASNGFLVPINEYTTASERAEFFENLLELYEYNGVEYGLPDWVATQILAYRKDLFDAAGFSAPRTWNDILRAAEYFADGDNMYGITFPGIAGGPLAGVFSSALIGNGGWFVDRNGNPTANSPAVVETAEFFGRLSRFAPPGYLNFHWEQSAELAANGRAAMALLMTTNTAWLDDPNRSNTIGRWEFVPNSNRVNGGMIDSYCWSVVRGTRHMDAAASLVKFIAGTEVQIYLTENMGTSGATRSYYENQALLASFPQLTALGLAFENTEAQPSWASWGTELEVLDNGLHSLFIGRTTARDAMNAMQTRMVENRR